MLAQGHCIICRTDVASRMIIIWSFNSNKSITCLESGSKKQTELKWLTITLRPTWFFHVFPHLPYRFSMGLFPGLLLFRVDG